MAQQLTKDQIDSLIEKGKDVQKHLRGMLGVVRILKAKGKDLVSYRSFRSIEVINSSISSR